MKCEYIQGVSGLRCPFYHLKRDGGIEALTEEFKERVCLWEDSTWIPVLEEYTAIDPERCPIWVQLRKEVYFLDKLGKYKAFKSNI